MLRARMRITGGRHRSRMLVAPRGHATRPTSDRVREALFGILTSAEPLAGARVLDLYAGTGALALEAVSRGAASAVVVERAKEALDSLRTNVTALKLGAEVRIVPTSVERAARALQALEPPAGSPGPRGFDLVFADPPYADVPGGAVAAALAAIVGAGLVNPGARVVLEHAKGDEPPAIEGLSLEDTRRYGDTCLAFYRAGEGPGVGTDEGAPGANVAGLEHEGAEGSA
jgi:16S rRNA (guanine966-N2)-methyltransferase